VSRERSSWEQLRKGDMGEGVDFEGKDTG